MKIFREYLWDVFILPMVVGEKARTCFVSMPGVEGIQCTKLVQGVAGNDLKDVVYSTVQ